MLLTFTQYLLQARNFAPSNIEGECIKDGCLTQSQFVNYYSDWLKTVFSNPILQAWIAENSPTPGFTYDVNNFTVNIYQNSATLLPTITNSAGQTLDQAVLQELFGVKDGMLVANATGKTIQERFYVLDYNEGALSDMFAPVVASAIADQVSDEDQPWSFQVPAGTFSDADSDALTLSATRGDGSDLPSWLSFDAATRTFSGTPPQDWHGDIDLKVTASDGSFTVSDTFILKVSPVADNPRLGTAATLANGTEDQSYTISEASLLQGWTDPDGTPLSVSSLAATNGTLTATATGWTFTPAADYNGTVNLTYNVVDGNGGVTAASRSFSLAAVNDPAVIGEPNNSSVTEDIGVVDGKLSVSGSISISDVDGSGEVAFQTAVTAGSGTLGTLVLQTNGTYTYSVDNSAVQYLNSGQFKTETFTITSVDGTTKSISFRIYGADETTKIAPAVVTGGGDPNDTAPAGAVTTATNQGDILKGTENNDSLDGFQGHDTIYGLAGNDSILGSEGKDMIYGGSGADTIDGGEGADIIIGGFGADLLTGGGAGDAFLFLDFRDTGDTITDFVVGVDKIAFKASLGVSFGDLIFTQSGGNTIVSVDKPGGSTTEYEMQFTLSGLKNLTASDFDFNF